MTLFHILEYFTGLMISSEPLVKLVIKMTDGLWKAKAFLMAAIADDPPRYIHTRAQHIMMGFAVSVVTAMVVTLGVVIVIYYLRRTRRIFSAEHSSEIDEGTGLGNRYYLERCYEEQVKPEKRHEYALVCLFADSERMERIYGREAMLDFVVYSADITQKYLNSHDFFCRIPGIGLVVLTKSKGEELTRDIPDLLQKIMRYSTDRGLLDSCRASAGIYRLKDTDDDIHECVFYAWQAAEKAYDANEDIAVCSDEMLAAFSEERQMRSEIAKGFENHEFVTYIQFYVDTEKCHIIGGEALTRWHHPEKGLIPPMRFISFMERENIISKMDYYSLEEVCKFLEEMNNAGINDFYISCNFSRKTFSSYDFVDNCREIFNKYNFPMSMIAFEMTESVNVKNIEQANQNALRLKDLGVKLLLDDFGEGFASFYDLTEYPVDGLKIDKALVDNIHTSKGNTILRGMTRMGHELNMTVIVEGVESDDQVKELQNIKCDVIQGFRFHRPIPVWEAKETLIKRGLVSEDDSATA